MCRFEIDPYFGLHYLQTLIVRFYLLFKFTDTVTFDITFSPFTFARFNFVFKSIFCTFSYSLSSIPEIFILLRVPSVLTVKLM